jgi:hypothetical protein
MSAQTAEIQRTLSAASLPRLLRNAITKPSAAKINQALSVTLTLVAHLGLQLLVQPHFQGRAPSLLTRVSSVLVFQAISNHFPTKPGSVPSRKKQGPLAPQHHAAPPSTMG